MTALLTAVAGWGLNLAALVLMGRAVGVEAGWQIFAVTIPVTLAATWLPLSANGIGVREGILVGLLTHAGVASGPATALSILIDLQMLPFALVGGLLWMRGSALARRDADRTGSETMAEVPAMTRPMGLAPAEAAVRA
jgi:hypothetical protein